MIQLFEMFAGYGGASFALKKANIPFECVGYSEIDKYAIQCYEQNHKGKAYGDCTKINPKTLPDFNLLTAGFPCQSFSVAGKGLGELDTRGTLFYDIIRIAEVKQPKYMLLENVKGLTYTTHKKTFNKMLSELSRIGYDVRWKILNSKEHGIPQNRERIFFVCKLGKWNDLPPTLMNSNPQYEFNFPEKEELKIFLKDILEEEVEEKYHLSEKQNAKLREHLESKKEINGDIINCIGTCFGRSGSSSEECESFARTNKALMERNKVNRIGGIYDKKGKRHQAGSIYDPKGLCPSLGTMQGGNRQPMIFDKASKKETEEFYWVNKKNDKKRPSYLKFQNGNHSEAHRYYNPNGIIQTIKKSPLKILNEKSPIRKLTPKECFRLMGFLNDEIKLDGLSNAQKYKLAGNGWDINLVSKIFKQMFKNEVKEK